jgi:hypothetical protein
MADNTDDRLDETLDNEEYQDDQQGLDVSETPLAQDFTTPAAPPDDVDEDSDEFTIDHPQTDTNVDAGEAYDAGQVTASGANAQEVEPSDDEERIA